MSPQHPAPQKQQRFEFVLRLADNCLILSQRLGEWCGHGPELEEDMALTNIALDLNGQAQNWLEYAAELDDQKRTPDMLAFQRDAGEFRNCLLVEHPNQDFAYTMARQFYFDTWHNLMLTELLDSSDQRIREISEKEFERSSLSFFATAAAGWFVWVMVPTKAIAERKQRSTTFGHIPASCIRPTRSMPPSWQNRIRAQASEQIENGLPVNRSAVSSNRSHPANPKL